MGLHAFCVDSCVLCCSLVRVANKLWSGRDFAASRGGCSASSRQVVASDPRQITVAWTTARNDQRTVSVVGFQGSVSNQVALREIILSNEYFVRRNGEVSGPNSLAMIRKGLEEKKLKANDLLSLSSDGPWERVAAVHKEIRAGRPFFDQGANANKPTETPQGKPQEEGLEDRLGAIDELVEEEQLLPPLRVIRPKKKIKKSVSREAEIDERLTKNLRMWAWVGGGLVTVAIVVAVVFAIPLLKGLRDRTASTTQEEEQQRREEGRQQEEEQQRQEERQRLAKENAKKTLVDGMTNFGAGLRGKKVKRVEIGAGVATITDDKNGLSHVKIECKNGLIIDADWKRAFNDFGYDIYEPKVSKDYNRLAVMTTARGVIASYLNGKYD